jgi:hypothetical protein
MGVAGQTAAAATGGLVGQLEADREDKGEDELDEGRAVADQLKVIALVVKIDGDGAVLAGRLAVGCIRYPLLRWRLVWMNHREGNMGQNPANCLMFALPTLGQSR